MTDTQGSNVVGCYGNKNLSTPNIDKLVQNGIKFENAYTSCPVCTPARAAIFTGIYPSKTGAFTNNLSITNDIKTMGERFSDKGYKTAYTGKWHLDGHDYFGTGKCPNGWDPDYWYDGKNYLDDLSDEDIKLWRSGLSTIEDLKKNNIKKEFTWAHKISDKGIKFLNNEKNKPFLLVLSYDEPHHPSTCPPEFAEKFKEYRYDISSSGEDNFNNKPKQHLERAKCGDNFDKENKYTNNPLYFGANSFVDMEIGRIIDEVDNLSMENTYIIFTSDHGTMLGAHRMNEKGSVMYEEITHIPLFIREPEGGNTNKIITTPVNHVDILPTMLEYAGLKKVPILDGESLIPFINGIESNNKCSIIEFTRHTIAHDGHGGFQPTRCIVKNNFKLVINLLDTDELYNLKNDPTEMDNLINNKKYIYISSSD